MSEMNELGGQRAGKNPAPGPPRRGETRETDGEVVAVRRRGMQFDHTQLLRFTRKVEAT